MDAEATALAVGAVGFALVVLVALSCVRHLLLVSETTRRCREVERAAEEAERLLADVMALVEHDRGRAAAHLYRQAVSLHTAMVLLAEALGPAGGPGASVAGRAADQMRLDLARQVDGLRRIRASLGPVGDRSPGPGRLVAPIRAYAGCLGGDGSRPDLTVEADPDLDLDPDWTTAVVASRIVQAAVDDAWRHAGASRIRVTFTAAHQALTIEVSDDGAGSDPAAVARAGRGSGLAPARALAEVVGGRLEVVSVPGQGTRVRATLGRESPPPLARPDLRLVDRLVDNGV